MSSERLITALDDIVRAVDLIDAWVKEAGGAGAALRADTQSRSAIERQLLIISEAAIRMHKIDPAATARRAPEVDWAGVRGIGNFIGTNMTISTPRSSPMLLEKNWERSGWLASRRRTNFDSARNGRRLLSGPRRAASGDRVESDRTPPHRSRDAALAEIAEFRRAVFVVKM